MTQPPDKPQPIPEPTPDPEIPQPPTEPVPPPPRDTVYPDATIPEPPTPAPPIPPTPPTPPPTPPAPPPTPQPPIPPTPPPPASAGGAVYGGPPQPAVSGGDGKRNLLGWLSLVFGTLGTGCCCCPWLNGWPFLGGIPAVVLGILHLRKVKRGEATNAWLGWVGIILGAIALIGAILGLVTDWGDRMRTEYDRQF